MACVALAVRETRAATLPVTGTLSFQLGNRGPIAAIGSGDVTVNGSGAGTHVDSLALEAGVFQTTAVTVQYTNPSTFAPFAGAQLTVANQAGGFAAGVATIPLFGVARLCAFGPCSAAVANLSIPLSVVGVGGSTFASAGAFEVTVVGAPWTTGTATADGGATAMGFRRGPASATSSTASASGVLQLVTPVAIRTNVPESLPILGFAVMTLRFVPEPTTLALVAAATGALALGAARRRLAPR